MRWLNQVVALTVITLRTIPQRLGTSLVVVIGIAGVVGVLVSVLAMSEGFRHTLASTGRYDRVILLRAGSDSEMSSGLGRDQTTLIAPLPGVARDAGAYSAAQVFTRVDVPDGATLVQDDRAIGGDRRRHLRRVADHDPR